MTNLGILICQAVEKYHYQDHRPMKKMYKTFIREQDKQKLMEKQPGE